MSELKKATLQEIESDEKGKPRGPAIEVQFNPSTLKLQINNAIEGGKSQGRQARQFIGSSSTTLTLDLVFDTADEGETDSPRNVREKTALVEKFLFPRGTVKGKQTPAKVRFHWGTLIFDGIISNITIDFDLFAANGTPLRAKVGVSIQEQNSKYQFLKAGAGANQAGNVPAPGAAFSGSVGTSAGISGSIGIAGSAGISAGVSASFGAAIGGESSAEFAARAGLDPAAWRGLSVGANSSLSLEAGAEIGFDAGMTASAGIGVSIGVEAGVSASLEGSFGLEATAGVSAVAGVGVGAGLAAGFNLSAAGGVSAAIESVKIAKAQAAEQKARQAFNAPAATVSQLGATMTMTTTTTTIARASTTTGGAGAAAPAQKPAMPEQRRAPLTGSGLPSLTTQQAARPAPAPPRADPRATSFGFGVPLRSTVGQAANMRSGAVQGHVALRPQTSSGEPPSTTDPTTPPWVSLPLGTRGRATGDSRRDARAHPCGCATPCRHRGGKRR